MKRLAKLTGLLLLALPYHANAADAPIEAWKPVEFLVGDWVGSGSGKPGEGAGEFSMKFDLDHKILVRRNRNQLVPKPGEKNGAIHEDLMIIYPQPGKRQLRAEFFDNEGHVIHYAVSATDHKAIFQSDDSSAVPKFRLTYELRSDNVLAIEFAIAPPGRPFQAYVSGTARRK